MKGIHSRVSRSIPIEMSEQLIVLVTGASQGIGYHIAQQLAATDRYKVLLGSRNGEKGQKAVDAIVADTNIPVEKGNIESIQIDIHYDGSIKAAAETIETKYGRLDIVSTPMAACVPFIVTDEKALEQRRHRWRQAPQPRRQSSRAVPGDLRYKCLRTSNLYRDIRATAPKIHC